jgi:hypothetical protein
MRKWTLAILLAACITGTMQAQFDAHFTHYWELLNFYNPAGAGSKQKMDITYICRHLKRTFALPVFLNSISKIKHLSVSSERCLFYSVS